MASQPGQDQDHLRLIHRGRSPDRLYYVLALSEGTHFEQAGDILICAKGISCKYCRSCSGLPYTILPILQFLCINVPAIYNLHLTFWKSLSRITSCSSVTHEDADCFCYVQPSLICAPIICVFMLGYAMHCQRKPALSLPLPIRTTLHC